MTALSTELCLDDQMDYTGCYIDLVNKDVKNNQ